MGDLFEQPSPTTLPRKPVGELYATPANCTEALLSVESFQGDVWEPACGNGAIVRVLEAAGIAVTATDLLDWGHGTSGLDFLASTHPMAPNIVTNPPFSLAEEFAALLAAATTPHINLFMRLALATAGRMGAILALTWSRVDFDAGTIQLGDGPKTKKGRATVPMTESLRAALLAAHTARTTPYVIEYGGAQVGKIRKAFERAAIAAGLPDLTPHGLRHTAAVWMAEAGVPMSEIAQYLGHSDERTTFRVYAIYSPGYLRKAASALEI